MSDTETGSETTTSIEESLAAGFDRATDSTPDSTTVPATAPPPAASGEPNAAPPLESPKHWSEADRTLFPKAPREIQQRWLDREKETAQGLDAKFQEIAGFRKERDQYQEILKPYEQELAMQGVTPPQFFKSLVGWQQYIQANPVEGLKRLAQTYGVDLTNLTGMTEAVDPNFAKVNQEIGSVKSTVDKFIESQRKQELESKLNYVKTFADEKGADGKPLRPYFDEVTNEINALMKTTPGMTLEQAYPKAIRMNDAVWEKHQAEQVAADKAKADAEKMELVRKAKKAAVPNGPGNATGTTRKLTLEEQMSELWDKAG